jgi:competence protein ComEA
MPDLTRRQLALYAAGLVVIVLLGARYLGRDDETAAGAAPAREPAIRVERSGGGRLTVHVAGAVRRPGLYRLRAGARVADAVERAGGATRRAELTGLNLAAKLEDGRQVIVPARASAAQAAAPGAAAPGAAEGPINLNTATLDELDQLDGIGPATAEKILEYRQEHGGFGSIEDLGQVPGIGDKRLATLREQVTV